MGDSAWAGVLMVTLAVLIAASFITLWIRDKKRADEESGDPERVQPDVSAGTRSRAAREGAADEPPELRRERRH